MRITTKTICPKCGQRKSPGAICKCEGARFSVKNHAEYLVKLGTLRKGKNNITTEVHLVTFDDCKSQCIDIAKWNRNNNERLNGIYLDEKSIKGLQIILSKIEIVDEKEEKT